MIFRKKQTVYRQNNVSEADILNKTTDKTVQNAKSKYEKRRLAVSIGILLIVGVSISFLIPYVNDLAKRDFVTEPLIIVDIFLLPLFCVLIGKTIMQAFGAFGIVRINQTKVSKAIHITVLTLIVLYTVIMLPFIIESIKCMILEFKFSKNPSDYPNGISYSYNIPLFLQNIEIKILNFDYKPAIFTVLGVILWTCKPNKQKTEFRT